MINVKASGSKASKAGMGNQYLVVSDLHLSDIEDHSDGWKAHKSSRFVFDEAFSELVKKFLRGGENGDSLTLILNGDIFDFDLVTAIPKKAEWSISSFEKKRGLNASANKSAWKLKTILANHLSFIAILAEFVSKGHKLVYIMGNHDREFHFPEVQKAFIEALDDYARNNNLSLAAGSVSFEPWFYYVADEIYAEHGHQFDYYSSSRYLLWPLVEIKGEEVVALSMGNISNRYMLNQMGFFSPHEGNFILNFFNYFIHWIKFYAFTKRSLIVHWFWGSLLVIFKMLQIKKRLRIEPSEHTQRMNRMARKYDLSQEEIRALGKLQSSPIMLRLFRMVRELWLDRVLVSLLMIGGTITLALVPIPLWIKLMVPLTSFPLLFFIYEYLVRGESIFAYEKEIPKRARSIAAMLPAKIITFGHSHIPRLIPLGKGTTFVDTGTWAPVMADGDRKRLADGRRNYLIVSIHKKEMGLTFESWM